MEKRIATAMCVHEKLSPALQALWLAVLAAAKIVQRETDRGVAAATKEGEPGGSHHSIATQADALSQQCLLTKLRAVVPSAVFLTEEKAVGPDIITEDRRSEVFTAPALYILDSFDGTAGGRRRRWDWSTVGNLFSSGQYQGGVVAAPAVRTGFEVVGERGAGVFVFDHQVSTVSQVTIEPAVPIKQSTVLFGVDIAKRRPFGRFSYMVSNAVETQVTAGSCGLGIATVAAGRAEAIVQPYQWAWDWATVGLVAIAGGKVILYHCRDGLPVTTAKPDARSFSRTDRKGGLGFIAGVPNVVDWLWQQLQENWDK